MKRPENPGGFPTGIHYQTQRMLRPGGKTGFYSSPKAQRIRRSDASKVWRFRRAGVCILANESAFQEQFRTIITAYSKFIGPF